LEWCGVKDIVNIYMFRDPDTGLYWFYNQDGSWSVERPEAG
jgi:hypothetical protein